jgi:hypothetical protein
MGFPTSVAERALVACGRHCCLCHKYCGTKIELHHIVPTTDGGNDEFDNCLPVCFDCHADVEHYNIKHPRGRKFTATELKAHRQQWYSRFEVRGPVVATETHLELDRQVYRKLKEVLPSDSSIHFIRFNNYAGFSFPLDQHKNLHDFLRACEFPEFEFIDPDLEGLRGTLRKTVEEFVSMIGMNTWRVPGTEGRNSVPSEWEDQQPERFEEVVNRLHDLTTQICDTYDSIIRIARIRLGIV